MSDTYGTMYGGAAPHKHGETQVEAAEFIEPHAAGLREKVFETLQGVGMRGMTNDEIANATSITLDTVKPRVRELRIQGRVKDSLQRRSNAPRSKGTSKVWRVALPGEPIDADVTARKTATQRSYMEGDRDSLLKTKSYIEEQRHRDYGWGNSPFVSHLLDQITNRIKEITHELDTPQETHSA